ncbi:MAG: serine/threonine-protein kinase, partial [Kofleriaceae bacterium]
MEADELVGSLVDGRYTVLAPMASGSMGAVYKAERVPVGKTVAIKFLHASFANDSEFLARFERETRVMSKLAHPNCVSVVDFGVWNGSPYLVMEYVGGRTLRTMLDDDGPIAPARALGLARQIAAGLAHAHAQGITHRDVKPANLMISEEIGTGEHVRILDFGLARLRGAVGRDATQINVVVGTPNYMAPEQTIGGGIIDARTDVYACGVVLFEMIAGERPFQAEDTLALLGMHRAAPIPRLSDRTDVELPRGLQEVVEKAMAKSPDDRYPSAIALAEAIDAIIGGRSTAEIKPVIGGRKLDSAAIAPTMVDIGSGSAPVASSMHIQAPSRGGGGKAIALLLLLVLGGGAYGAYYLKNRADRKDASATAGSDLPAGSARSEIGSGAGSAIPAGSDSAELAAPADAEPVADIDTPPVQDAGAEVAL